jgi:DNA-binding NtrC family response regulator
MSTEFPFASPVTPPADSPAFSARPLAPPRVLIAEDEPHLGRLLARLLDRHGATVTTVADGLRALELLRLEPFDVVLLDVDRSPGEGLLVLRHLRETPAPPSVILVASDGPRGIGPDAYAPDALALGAYHVLAKPYRALEVEAIVQRAWETRQVARENERLRALARRRVRGGAVRAAEEASLPEFVTQYAPLRAVVELLERSAGDASPVLVAGGRGTGKRLVARLLHARGARADGPLVEVDGTVPEAPHDAGAFVGEERPAAHAAGPGALGLLDLASGGTLLLHHAEALDRAVLTRLLRLTEAGSFYRVGGTQRVPVDARLVLTVETAGAPDPPQLEALRASFDRLGGMLLRLPTLAERTGDIPLLATHFVRRFGGRTPPRLSSDAVSALEGYPWPGNVRELRAVIERAVLLVPSGVIEARDLLPDGTGATGALSRPEASLTLAALERRHVEAVLHRVGWHQGRAAAQLGISAKTLYRKMRTFGLRRPMLAPGGAS